jgi:hypothetical protein
MDEHRRNVQGRQPKQVRKPRFGGGLIEKFTSVRRRVDHDTPRRLYSDGFEGIFLSVQPAARNGVFIGARRLSDQHPCSESRIRRASRDPPAEFIVF